MPGLAGHGAWLDIAAAHRDDAPFPQGLATGSFVYNPAYLKRPDAVPLEPYELPLSPRRFQTVKLKGIFGALRDASPDAWGRRIIDKHVSGSPNVFFFGRSERASSSPFVLF